jgi:hypothetical protein
LPASAPTPTGSTLYGTSDLHKHLIEATVALLKARGVEFTGPVVDRGYGLVTHFKVPGGFAVQLYQPRFSKTPAGQVK